MLTQAHKQSYEENGYVVVGGLFSQEEVAAYRDHFMTLRKHDTSAGADATSSDPLKRYPRLMQMHRWDETSLRWLIDDRIERLSDRPAGHASHMRCRRCCTSSRRGARPGAASG